MTFRGNFAVLRYWETDFGLQRLARLQESG